MMMTGECNYDAVVAAVNKAGIYKFLRKPFNYKSLKKVIGKGVSMYRKTLEDMQEKVEKFQEYILPISQLRPGMTIDERICLPNGVLLLAAGHVLTASDLNQLRLYDLDNEVRAHGKSGD